MTNKEKVYLIVIDKTGERKTSYRVRVHANTMEELKHMAESEYKGCLFVEDDGTLQTQLCDGTKIYVNGEVVDKPEYIPTEAERRKAKIMEIKAETDAANTALQERMMTALLQGNDKLATQLRDQYQANNEAMIKKIQEV